MCKYTVNWNADNTDCADERGFFIKNPRSSAQSVLSAFQFTRFSNLFFKQINHFLNAHIQFQNRTHAK
jgi:hypothetical protein